MQSPHLTPCHAHNSSQHARSELREQTSLAHLAACSRSTVFPSCLLSSPLKMLLLSRQQNSKAPTLHRVTLAQLACHVCSRSSGPLCYFPFSRYSFSQETAKCHSPHLAQSHARPAGAPCPPAAVAALPPPALVLLPQTAPLPSAPCLPPAWSSAAPAPLRGHPTTNASGGNTMKGRDLWFRVKRASLLLD